VEETEREERAKMETKENKESKKKRESVFEKRNKETATGQKKEYLTSENDGGVCDRDEREGRKATARRERQRPTPFPPFLFFGFL
jgi:hypothetical protein